MKKVWVSMLIILLIFSLISCGNGKNGTTKEIQTIKGGQFVEKKFEIEPYQWVSRKPILKNSELSNTEGSWQYECERYKKLEEEGKEELEDGHKLGERLILYLEVIFINGTNIMEHRPWGSPDTCNYHHLSEKKYFVFDTTMSRYRDCDIDFYTDDKKKLDSNIYIFIQSYEGESEYSKRLKKYYRDSILQAEKQFGKVEITDEELYYIEPDANYPSDDMAFRDLPLRIKSSTFCTRTPGPDFYSLSDLEILEVDVNGNIRTRYGNDEFIISPGESWQSKIKKQELSKDLFVYDWPYQENGEWKKVDYKKIYISARRRDDDGSMSLAENTYLITDDEYLNNIAKQDKLYDNSEFIEIYKYIKKKYPDFELNFEPNEWDKISIGYKFVKNLKNVLPKKDNTIFVSQIKIINYGWRIYYY